MRSRRDARKPLQLRGQALGTVLEQATVAPGKGEAWERIEIEWKAA